MRKNGAVGEGNYVRMDSSSQKKKYQQMFNDEALSREENHFLFT